MNDAPRVKREKSNQPSNNKNDRHDVKYTSHIFCFLNLKMQTPCLPLVCVIV